jgi:2-polyprenyl-6-methoxyphenol hydroxylase-like FAD-dependent oxidoreductase
MMLGLLLARAGVAVTVLEKHADFLRDFRGDTIHPSTLEVLHELGLLDEFLALPHQKARELHGSVEGVQFPLADFSRVPARCKFIAFIPQWDFLDFLAEQAARYSGFDLRMRTEATDLLLESGRVVGVRAETPEGSRQLRADLVVAADGRHSVLREKAGLEVRALGAPMDVLWFRLSRRPQDPDEFMGRFAAGRIFILINRDTYWQCGYVIAKGSMERLRAGGIEALREGVAAVAPFLADRAAELRGWDDVALLTVRVDRLERWYREGLLCIGDAAHAMSPAGGVGINLAIQDAVAAANLLASPLLSGRMSAADLAKVQQRRLWPTRVTQWFQVAAQERIISRVLEGGGKLKPPPALRLLARFPALRRLAGRLIGIGVRPEHVANR